MSTYKIAVVVDEAFGERLVGIAKLIHVWVCDTPVNRQAAETVIAQLVPERVWNEQGVTTFRFSVDETPEEMIINRLATIDEHHFAWSQIEVYGVGPTPRLRQELQGYGVTDFQETPGGFICTRTEAA